MEKLYHFSIDITKEKKLINLHITSLDTRQSKSSKTTNYKIYAMEYSKKC